MSHQQYRLVTNSPPGAGVRREQGLIDARSGKPILSRDKDYLRGYELGQLIHRSVDAAPEAPAAEAKR